MMDARIEVAPWGEHALSACINGQQVAMLDFTIEQEQITLNMVFVKPPFRHHGIAMALLRAALKLHGQVRWLNRGREWRRPKTPVAQPAPAA